MGKITRMQICKQIKKAKHFKALRPDGIPNIMLINTADLITNRLYYIYKAMLEKGLQFVPWKISTTVVL